MAKYRSHLGAIWPWWDRMHVESEPPQGSHDKQDPITWKNTNCAWVRSVWPCWDRMHAESKQPHKGSHDKKEPITWKNTDRTWVRSGPAGTKCTFPANTCSTQAAMTKREPIIKTGPAGTKCMLKASHPKAAMTKSSQSYGKIQIAPGCDLALVGQNAC